MSGDNLDSDGAKQRLHSCRRYSEREYRKDARSKLTLGSNLIKLQTRRASSHSLNKRGSRDSGLSSLYRFPRSSLEFPPGIDAI